MGGVCGYKEMSAWESKRLEGEGCTLRRPFSARAEVAGAGAVPRVGRVGWAITMGRTAAAAVLADGRKAAGEQEEEDDDADWGGALPRFRDPRKTREADWLEISASHLEATRRSKHADIVQPSPDGLEFNPYFAGILRLSLGVLGADCISDHVQVGIPLSIIDRQAPSTDTKNLRATCRALNSALEPLVLSHLVIDNDATTPEQLDLLSRPSYPGASFVKSVEIRNFIPLNRNVVDSEELVHAWSRIREYLAPALESLRRSHRSHLMAILQCANGWLHPQKMTSDGSTEPLVANYAVWSHPVAHCQKATKWLQWLLRKLAIVLPP
ncbi:hypothetical protein DFH09DRAFT_1091842 [Mycena vulgaris]|nr:hypothetical protein DFH09DRAFT_1091842 [Mycena vulgaris]